MTVLAILGFAHVARSGEFVHAQTIVDGSPEPCWILGPCHARTGGAVRLQRIRAAVYYVEETKNAGGKDDWAGDHGLSRRYRRR